jgi:hypothetical protein
MIDEKILEKEFVNKYLLKNNFPHTNRKNMIYYESKLTEWSLKYDFINYIKLKKDHNKYIIKMYVEATMILKDQN